MFVYTAPNHVDRVLCSAEQGGAVELITVTSRLVTTGYGRHGSSPTPVFAEGTRQQSGRLGVYLKPSTWKGCKGGEEGVKGDGDPAERKRRQSKAVKNSLGFVVSTAS